MFPPTHARTRVVCSLAHLGSRLCHPLCVASPRAVKSASQEQCSSTSRMVGNRKVRGPKAGRRFHCVQSRTVKPPQNPLAMVKKNLIRLQVVQATRVNLRVTASSIRAFNVPASHVFLCKHQGVLPASRIDALAPVFFLRVLGRVGSCVGFLVPIRTFLVDLEYPQNGTHHVMNVVHGFHLRRCA